MTELLPRQAAVQAFQQKTCLAQCLTGYIATPTARSYNTIAYKMKMCNIHQKTYGHPAQSTAISHIRKINFKNTKKQACVQTSIVAGNMTLIAFAAARRADTVPGGHCYRSISSMCQTHSSKPATG